MARNQRGPRRRTHWSEISGAVTVTATGATLLSSLPGDHQGETLIRSRGLAVTTLEAGNTVGDGFFGAIGLAIVSAAAAAAGVGSVPTPITEAAWDGWLMHRYISAVRAFEVGGPGLYTQYELDSKVMRKVTEDDALILVVDVVETGTATMSIEARIRLLSMTN